MLTPIPSRGFASLQARLVFRLLILCALVLGTTACITTHSIRTIGREAKLYKDATIRWVLLNDGTRITFAAPGAQYYDSAPKTSALQAPSTDTTRAAIPVLSYPAIAGNVQERGTFEIISLKDILEIAAEQKTFSGEDTALLLTWLSILGVVAIAIAIIAGGGFGGH